MMSSKLKRFFLLFIVFFWGVLFGSVIFFPWSNFVDFINSKSDIIHIESAGFSFFPFGVKLLGLEVRTREGKELYFKELKISPSLFSPLYLVFGKFKGSLKLKTEKSAITINFTAKNIFRPEKMSLSSVYLTGDISSEELMSIFDLGGKGNLKIELKLNGDIRTPNSLEGKFLLSSSDKDKTIIVLKNTNKLHVPVEGEFSLGKVNAEVTIKNGVMTLDRFEMRGGNIEGSGKGSLIIKNPFFESQIDLTFELKTNLLNIPSQTIRLKGTLSSPKIG